MADASSIRKQGWEAAFEALEKEHCLGSDGLGIFAINLRFGLDDFTSIAAEAITGGGDDKKCDVLYVDKERQLAVIAQCYISATQKQAAPSNKASDLNTAVTWLLSSPLDDLPNALKGRADELRTAINQGEVRQLHIWYVHNLPPSGNVASELKAVERTAKAAVKASYGGRDLTVFSNEICSQFLEKLYTQAERTIIVTDTLTALVPDAFEIKSSDWTALSTVVNGKWLRDLYKKYSTDLFSANLRGYLGSRQSDSNINNNIKVTASNEPQNFCVYNNGITAIVNDFRLGPRRTNGRRLEVDGMSIVNGAQTTGSISSITGEVDDALKVPIRFVKSTKESIVSNVVQYNNTQNKIQAADFRSNDPIQDKLRAEFSSVPDAEYEGGRRGGASDIIKRSKYSLPSYTVGQALAAFHGDPVTAYDKKSELWTSEIKYRHIFTERTSARHIVFCYSLLSEINGKKLKLHQKQKSGDITAVQLNNLEFLNRKGASYLMVWAVSECLESILGRVVPNKFDLHFKDNIAPAAGEDRWRPITDVVLSLSKQLDAAFSRGRISNDSVQKAVPHFVGVIDSLTEVQAKTFADFSAHVA